MKLDIISPEKKLFSGDVVSVTLPGLMGSFTVLEGHAPIISSLKSGIVSYRRTGENEDIEVSVSGGFVEGKDNEVNVCID